MNNKEETKYLFYKKIKPDTYIWSTSMQASVKFEEEMWIGVISEHTTCFTDDKIVFYGNLFKNDTLGLCEIAPASKLEFEVWEESGTVGERIKERKDIPNNNFHYMDLPLSGDDIDLTKCFVNTHWYRGNIKDCFTDGQDQE